MFKDRLDAGRLLAERLSTLPGRGEPKADVVIGLARGGVVVARAVADLLKIPCDVLVVKKIPSPLSPELALGAVAPDDVIIRHEERIVMLEVDEGYIRSQIHDLRRLIQQKTRLYQAGRDGFEVGDKRIVLADDGLATGATMEAAIAWSRGKRALHVTVALPVASRDALSRIRASADLVIVLEEPPNFDSVGRYYEHFEQVDDAKVVQLLRS